MYGGNAPGQKMRGCRPPEDAARSGPKSFNNAISLRLVRQQHATSFSRYIPKAAQQFQRFVRTVGKMKTQHGHIWAESNDGLKRLIEVY
jgi:hypothetical protein